MSTPIKAPSVSQGSGPIITPGNHLVRASKFILERVDTGKANGYRVKLEVETEPIPGLKGLKKPNSEERYAGQVGTVGLSAFLFTSGQYGEDYEQVMSSVAYFLMNLGQKAWYDENLTAESLEAWFEKLNKDAPFRDIWFQSCIGGREYMSGGTPSYIRYDLYFVKSAGPHNRPQGLTRATVIDFNPQEHIRRLAGTTPAPAPTAQQTQNVTAHKVEDPLDFLNQDEDFSKEGKPEEVEDNDTQASEDQDDLPF